MNGNRNDKLVTFAVFVDHSLLLKKLKDSEITCTELKWFQNSHSGNSTYFDTAVIACTHVEIMDNVKHSL